MSVRVAASAGFCFGVDRAVGLVEQTVREGKRAVTLGPIIHNHHVVQHFAALGGGKRRHHPLARRLARRL